ncbi:hydrolase 1, exosortase A system-associated [Hydrogenophaga sp.]|uniref:hydrolase 1, exosortase A system-associated n=1 Tax=Hydrogenophaga sp. TaxID=1904254 RepID=UPI00286E8037|nr:hydrolase 1, exosortase A system-associated [Hydrogenophaga sp.]
MLGVLHSPHTVPSGLGVVIVNGGAQYRAGAHRLFVQLARQMAEQGHAVLRFDFPGQGDSPGDSVGFEETAPHIGAAIDALHHHCPALEQTALLGLCDGASASLLYLHATNDPRVTHLALLNPWARSELVQARTQIRHYYRQRLFMPDFWRKLMAGGVGLRAVRELLGTMTRSRRSEPASSGNFQGRMAQAWKRFPGALLLLICDKDLTGLEFIQTAMEAAEWKGALQHPGLTHHVVQQADHTFSSAAATQDLNALIRLWVKKTLSEKPPLPGDTPAA